MASRMYEETVTWNPFKGCRFDCTYCKPSFKRQAKRQKNRCIQCYNYEPHFHQERLQQRFPHNKLIFACGNGDISFANQEQKEAILNAIKNNPESTFLLQSKNPFCFIGLAIPDNAIVGTTIETNRDTRAISKAPETYERVMALQNVPCRKFVTIEPIMDFDIEVMINWMKIIKPEIVWVGYNNYPTSLRLIEPSLVKTKRLIEELKGFTEVRLKTLREAK